MGGGGGVGQPHAFLHFSDMGPLCPLNVTVALAHVIRLQLGFALNCRNHELHLASGNTFTQAPRAVDAGEPSTRSGEAHKPVRRRADRKPFAAPELRAATLSSVAAAEEGV